MYEHRETIDGITYTLTIEPEDTPVRGNALASGDDAADAQAERAINMQLASGNQWAWCTACVTAEINGVEASIYLGCCSHDSEADFIACELEALRVWAKAELVETLVRAAQALATIGGA